MKRKKPDEEEPATKVDPTSVFIRGLGAGTSDLALRAWLEARAGPTVTCFAIRDDYGLAKFKSEADAQRCLRDLQGSDFEGRALRFETAKPKRGAPPVKASRKRAAAAESGEGAAKADGPASAAASAAGSGDEAEVVAVTGKGKGKGKGRGGEMSLHTVQLMGLPPTAKKQAVQAWVEEHLPGGCGIENVKRIMREKGVDKKNGVYVVSFRKEANARRAVEQLQSKDFEGSEVVASFRALEMSKHTTKAGRLIVRNLAFDATTKHLRKAFEPLGTLTDVNVPTKVNSAGDPVGKGFAFVQYADRDTAEKAIATLNGTKICGRGVAVDWVVDSQLYSILTREDEQQREKQEAAQERAAQTGGEADAKKQKKKKAEPEKKVKKKAKGEEDDDEDEEDDKMGDDDSHKKEVSRMKKLMNDDKDEDSDDDDDEDEEEEEEEKEGDTKKRDTGHDIGEKKTIFVRNVPFDATEEDLRGLFKKFGKLRSVKLVKDPTGANAHKGSAFVIFFDRDGAQAALAAEAEADKKLKELSAIVKKSDKRELPAVEGFGIALKGRRLVLKEAVTPGEVTELQQQPQKMKATAKEERRQWFYLLNVGEITEESEEWKELSVSEQRQRKQGMKERKFRISNPNFMIEPLRLSMRNLPKAVDAQRLRQAVIKHVRSKWREANPNKSKQDCLKAMQAAVTKVSLCRDQERRDENNAKRSRGFGFVQFAEHETAMSVLEYINNSPTVFGGINRPIVEFAIEDKRQLRMQRELYQKHAHKLLGEAAKEAEEGKDADAAEAEKRRRKKLGKHKKLAEGVEKVKSRGQRQREKRRGHKAAAEEKTKLQEAFRKKKKLARVHEMKEEKETKEWSKPRRANKIPDADLKPEKRQRHAGPADKAGGKKQKVGHMADDFELKAMERFRAAGF